MRINSAAAAAKKKMLMTDRLNSDFTCLPRMREQPNGRLARVGSTLWILAFESEPPSPSPPPLPAILGLDELCLQTTELWTL